MVKVSGYDLKCPICGGTEFSKRTSLLNSRGLTFLNLDWSNQGAINYICERCGYILWFIDDGREFIEKLEHEKHGTVDVSNLDYEPSRADEDECPICFSRREKNEKECTNCGHVFKG
jgi:hypothetical protein